VLDILHVNNYDVQKTISAFLDGMPGLARLAADDVMAASSISLAAQARRTK
jgi:hypothetical protein